VHKVERTRSRYKRGPAKKIKGGEQDDEKKGHKTDHALVTLGEETGVTRTKVPGWASPLNKLTKPQLQTG